MEAYRRRSLVDDPYGNRRGLCWPSKTRSLSHGKICDVPAVQVHRIVNYRRNEVKRAT